MSLNRQQGGRPTRTHSPDQPNTTPVIAEPNQLNGVVIDTLPATQVEEVAHILEPRRRRRQLLNTIPVKSPAIYTPAPTVTHVWSKEDDIVSGVILLISVIVVLLLALYFKETN